jgi:monothiol glutaredoxin
MSRDVRKEIDDLVKQHRIVLFMKGSKLMPQCGFSARAVQILGSYGQPFETVNVLADPEVRQGVKDYSNWPTVPQCYIDGQFIGGSDILMEMHESDELKALLGAEA